MPSARAKLRAVVDPPADDVSDPELVARALRGDRRAEEAIFLRHAPGVTQMADRLLGSETDAEDVVQHTFEVAFRRLEQLDRPGSLRAWLLSIAVRRCHRVFRRRKLLRLLGIASHPEPDTLIDHLASGSSPESRAELALLDVALTRVPEKERVAWMLRKVEGLSLPECATACGCSLATVKRRIQAADTVVRAHLEGSR
ncbi:MAG: RNA polymerase sigma factor [Sandaracinaceae bacterium]